MTETTGWSDLNTYTTRGLLDHLDYLRRQKTYKEAANLKIEARAYELRIAAVERVLAIHNRRATEDDERRVAEERTVAATLRGLRNALLGWRDDVDAACLDWGHTITDRIDAMLKLAPSDEHWDRLVTIADEAFGLGPVEPLDATLARIERGIFEQHQRIANLEVQREADLREAWMAGHRATVAHSGVTDGGCGPSLMTPSESDAEEWAAEYARSKAGG